MGVIADWTTTGPYRSVSWLLIGFTLGVIVTLVLALIELVDSYATYKAVKDESDNELTEGLDVLVTSSVIRSVNRLIIQVAFFAIAGTNLYFSITSDIDHLYWYRIVFIIAFLGAEAVLCFSIINDIVARHKLEEFIVKRRKELHD